MYSLLYYLYIEYKQDYKELEERLLQLEKRTSGNFKNVSRQIIELQDMYIEKENNIQEGCECDMPCGRKGRPKGSKNIGGRRK